MGKLYYEDKDKLSCGIDSHVEMFREIIEESKCENIVKEQNHLVDTQWFFGILLCANYILPYSAQTFIREHQSSK